MHVSNNSSTATKRWITIAIACLVLIGSLAAFKFFQIQSAIAAYKSQPEYSETVEVLTAQEIQKTAVINALGEAVAPQQVALRNELQGYVVAVNFPAGSHVKRDDIIIQLDISQENANLKSAKARYALAKSVYQREMKLRKANAVSQEDLDRARSDLDVVDADIEGLRSIINKKTIRAAFDGVIGIHQFEVGQYLESNSLITTLVGNNDYMWVDFSVPQFYGDLAQGTQVRVRLVRSQHSAVSEFVDAEIIASNSIIDSNARSRRYRAKVSKLKLPLIHNASVEVQVPVSDKNDLIVVNASAVQNDALGRYVFLLDPNQEAEGYRARRASITMQGQEGEHIFISSGIKVGDTVAAAGSFKLFEGLLVYANKRPTESLSNNADNNANDSTVGQ